MIRTFCYTLNRSGGYSLSCKIYNVNANAQNRKGVKVFQPERLSEYLPGQRIPEMKLCLFYFIYYFSLAFYEKASIMCKLYHKGEN